MTEPAAPAAERRPAWRGGNRPPASPAGALLRAAALVLAVALCGAQPVVFAIATNLATGNAATAQADYTTAADALANNAARLPYSGYAQNRAGLASISASRSNAAAWPGSAPTARPRRTPRRT